MFDFTKAQQEAIETLDRNVSVSAGAGSGKTRVLVERLSTFFDRASGRAANR